MLKSNEKLFLFTQKLLDLIVAAFAWYISFKIRFHIFEGQSGLEELYLKLSPFIILLTYYFFSKNGLYKSLRFRSRYSEILTVFKANSIAIFTFIILIYFFSESRISRGMLGGYFFLSQFSLIILRLSVRNFLRSLRRKGRNLRHILLVGHGNQIKEYVSTVKNFKDAGIRFVGWIDSGDLNTKFEIQGLDIGLEEAKTTLHPDTIIIGYPGNLSQKVEDILKLNYNDLVPIQVIPDLSYSFIGHQIDDFAGIPIMSFNHPRLSTTDTVIKRCFDFCAVLVGLIIISPLLLILALMVKLSSKGPILYGQERMGLDGKKFQMWKFRSMKMDAEKDTGAVWAKENDPRRTNIGSFLRSTSLDELPQLLNVLVGNMSLVGPRPERPIFVEKFRNEIPAYMLRHKMKAGITGWAQVNGWRGDTSLEKRIECDIYYIKNWSLWLDVKIIFLTFLKGFINKNAY